MNNFSWAKAFGYGIAIWMIMFIVAAILAVGFGVTLGAGMWVSLAVLAGIISYLFATGTEAATSGQALGYGFAWAVIGIVLDVIISYRFQSNIFGLWEYYLGYALVVSAPWFEYEMQGSGVHRKPV
jgi:hypothetical protein